MKTRDIMYNIVHKIHSMYERITKLIVDAVKPGDFLCKLKGIRQRKIDAIAVLAIILYIVALSAVSIYKLYIFTSNWDLGTARQALHSVLQGRLLEVSTESFFGKEFPEKLTISFLAIHFSPIMLLLVPFYALFPTPETLLVLQTIWIAAGGIAIYLMAKKLYNARVGLIFLLSYLLNPLTITMNLNSFHIETLLTPLLLFASYYGLSRNWRNYIISTLLAANVIEYAPIIVAALNITILLYHRKQLSRMEKYALVAYTIASIIYAYIAYHVRVFFGLDPHGVTAAISLNAWSILGARNPLEVPLKAITNPLRALNALITDIDHKLLLLAMLLVPLLGLPLLNPLGLLPALPWLGVALLSNYPPYYALNFKVTFCYFAFYVSAILGFEKIYRAIRSCSTYIESSLLRHLFAIMLLTGALLASIAANARIPVVNLEHVEAKHEALNLIPSNASILTTDDALPYLANRLNVYVIPTPGMKPIYSKVSCELLNVINPEYVLIDILSPFSNVREQSYYILDNFVKKHINEYGVLYAKDGILLFKRGYKGLPENWVKEQTQQLIFEIDVTELKVKPHIPFKYVYTPRGKALFLSVKNGTATIWYGPYIYLPRGRYVAELELEVELLQKDYNRDKPLFMVDVVYHTGSKVLVKHNIYATNTSRDGRIYLKLRLQFELKEPAFDLEIRGRYASINMNLLIYSIKIYVHPGTVVDGKGLK